MKLHDRVSIPRLFIHQLFTFKHQVPQLSLKNYVVLLQTMRKTKQSWKTRLLLIFIRTLT